MRIISYSDLHLEFGSGGMLPPAVNGDVMTLADDIPTSTVYGTSGLPSSVTDANGKTTQFQYDGSGNLKQQTDALKRHHLHIRRQHNRLSQTVTRTVNGQPQTITTGYKYDADNHLTETDYADGTKMQVQYNAIGKQSVTIDQLGHQTRYTYNSMTYLLKNMPIKSSPQFVWSTPAEEHVPADVARPATRASW